LSTPIAYIKSSESFFDPFSLFETMSPSDPRYQFHRYGYINMKFTRQTNYPRVIDPSFETLIGKWRLDGYGPARVYGTGGWLYGPSYDPTNGTVSPGEIFRSQKYANHVQYGQ
ncbi:MAG TPA: hypothetical protein PKH07_04535, partial [bacterium]|nr:hypothetical protein [bacterium]